MQICKNLQKICRGLNTNLGDKGVRLSGGQKQRIGIARVLYKNPSLIVFDEATSSLDIQTGNNIMDTIYKLKQKKTFIIVAHRLSTIARCDKVYRIEKVRLLMKEILIRWQITFRLILNTLKSL